MAQVLILASLGEKQVCCLHELAMLGKILLLVWNLNPPALLLSSPVNMVTWVTLLLDRYTLIMQQVMRGSSSGKIKAGETSVEASSLR